MRRELLGVENTLGSSARPRLRENVEGDLSPKISSSVNSPPAASNLGKIRRLAERKTGRFALNVTTHILATLEATDKNIHTAI